MSDELLLSKLVTNAVIIGIGATVVMDIWAILLQRIFGIAPLNFAFVGRWLAYMPRGVVCHDDISRVEPVAVEAVVGWVAHYLIGIIFAIVLLMFTGNAWLMEPSLLPAITFGALTVTFPYFIMQPCLGLGIAAAKTPKPNVARFRSLLTHVVFGLGLYFSAIINVLFFAL
ncbi:MAG: DUF2938 domain-containing protein [Oceanospirillaceae bacterium]